MNKPNPEYNKMGARIITRRGIANAKFVTSSKVGISYSVAPIQNRAHYVKVSDQANKNVKDFETPFSLNLQNRFQILENQVDELPVHDYTQAQGTDEGDRGSTVKRIAQPKTGD